MTRQARPSFAFVKSNPQRSDSKSPGQLLAGPDADPLLATPSSRIGVILRIQDPILHAT